MAILKQTSERAIYQGWYGLCKDGDAPCQPFPLITGTGSSSAYVHDNIHEVFEIMGNAEAELRYDGNLSLGLQINTLPIKELKCGKCYRIIMKPGDAASADPQELNIPDFTYANAGSDDQQDINNRITNDCSSGGGSGDYSFTTISTISDTLDEGYLNSDATDYDAEAHDSIITNATGVASVAIQADALGLEYSTNGISWADLGTSVVTISSDFTNLQLRVKVGLSAGTYNRVVQMTATPENPQFISLDKTINYNINVNNVSLSVSPTSITEELEEGAVGNVHEVDISHENIESVHFALITGNTYLVGETPSGPFVADLNLFSLGASPIKVYVKLQGTMPNSDVSNTLRISGKRRNSGPDIVLTNAVTASATVAPRPQITALSANILSGTVADPTGSIEVSLSVEHETNYGGHHWHYEIEDTDGSIVVSEKMVNAGSGGFGGTSLSLADFPDPGTYTLTAWIVTQGHQKIAGSLDKTANFVIAANDATLSVNKPAISEILDIDETQVTHTITVTSNNLTNLTLSPASLNNWTYTQLSGNTFTVSLKDSVKNTDLGYDVSFPGPVDLARETLTLTGDVGPGDSSGDSTKSVDITLDAKLVDKSEFSITGANLNVTDNRDYGESAQEFGPYTITYDEVHLSVNLLNNWEVEFNNSGTWTSTWSPPSNFASGSTFKVRNNATLVGSYNETLTLTPTPTGTDHDASDDPSPVTLTLNCTISELSANLVNPGTQTLTSITSGESVSDKTFTTAGTNIQNITISEVSSGWNLVPSDPELGGVVAVAYTGDAVSTGTKTGTFKISADAVTGASFGGGITTQSYVVDLSFVVNPKLAEVNTNPSSITLNPITSGGSSNVAYMNVSGSNVDNIVLTTIPAGFVVRNGATTLSNGASGLDGTQLTISLADTTTPGTRNGTIVLTGTASANSAFSGGVDTKNVSVSGVVNSTTATITVNPSSLSWGSVESGSGGHEDKFTTVTSENVDNIVVTTIPDGFALMDGNTMSPVNQGASIGSGTDFVVMLVDTSMTLGSHSGDVVLTGTPNANSQFNGANTKTITLSVTITGLPTSLSISPSSVTDNVDENGSVSAHEITLTQNELETVSVSGGNASKYQVSSSENGTYENSISLDNTASSFWVKLMDTSSAGTISTNFTISGTKSSVGASNPSNVTLSCSGVVNAVVTGPSTLWLAFSENGNTSGKYSPFYELKHSETEQGEVKNIADSNIQFWNDMVDSGSMPPGVEVVSDSFTFDRTKHSAVHPTAGLFSVFGGGTPGVPSAFQSYFSSDEDYLNGLEGATVTKVVTTGWVTTITWDVSFTIALDHTKFEFVNPDHETEITSWMSSASVANLVEVLITESPTQPNIEALSSTDIASAFNSPSLSLKCGDTWNGELAPLQQTKMVITRDNAGIPEPFNYSAIAQTAPILSSGKWSGVGGGFANNNALGQVKSPSIMYFHFEKASGTKVKFSDGNPSGSHCGIS